MSPLHPALGTLARLKWRAWWRRLGRRLRTPGGALFGLLGLAVMGLWIWSVVWRSNMVRLGTAAGPVDPTLAEAIARATMLAFALVVVGSAFGHRGLYLPQDEVERLLAAPLTRRQLVRYRLCSTLLRSLVFALIMAVLVAPRMPRGAFGFLGTLAAMCALPLVGQGAAILMGDAENRLGRLAGRVPRGLVRVVAGLGLWALIMLLVMGEDLFGDRLGDLELEDQRPEGVLGQIGNHPLVVAIGAPTLPWVRAMAATDLAGFLPWFLGAVALTALLFEGVARLPIDFRELSLATSADVARRLSRVRSGRGAVSGMEVSDRARGLRVPWLLGRGPFGAVAWLELVALRRKARGALLFALFTTGFALLLATSAFRDPLGGAIFLGIFGVVYLASGLRFDFRGNLDLMETIRAWPVPSRQVFLATLLPETLVVALLMGAAQLVRAAALGVWPPEVGLVVAVTPFATLLWLALDNLVFLLAPVRFEPGQASAMHHAGRTLALVVLKVLLLGLVALAVGLSAGASWALVSWLGGAGALALAAGVLGGVLTTLGAIAAVIVAGGWALARFDVAAVKARLG